MDYNNDTLCFEIDDKLRRGAFATSILNMLDNLPEKREHRSFVVALDSPWGSGKTYFLHMLRNTVLQASGKNGKPCANVLYYNAWDNDDWKDAFVPFVYMLRNMVACGREEYLTTNLRDKAIQFANELAPALAADFIEKMTGSRTAKVTTGNNEYFKMYDDYLSEKDKFKANLTELLSDESTGYTLVLVDELDRCRPEFAIETLEIIKHFFDVEKMIFIFALDVQQLSFSIATKYGQSMDTVGYLRRFFDLDLKIPTPNRKVYVNYLINELYFGKLDCIKEMRKEIANIVNKLRLSLRDINKIMNNYYMFCLYHHFNLQVRISHSEPVAIMKPLEIFFYFMCLKYKHPEIYTVIISKPYRLRDNHDIASEFVSYKFVRVSDIVAGFIDNLQGGKMQDSDRWSDWSDIVIDGTSAAQRVSCGEYIETRLEMFEPD